MPPGFKGFQAFEEGEHHKTDTHWRLLPIRGRDVKPLWKGHKIKHVAHDAVSSDLVSSSVPQNRGHVSMKVPGAGLAEAQAPVIHYERL